MSERSARRGKASNGPAPPPVTTDPLLADTDALNEARGAAPEGQTAEPGLPVQASPRVWAEQPEPEPDNTFYAAAAEGGADRSTLPAPAPEGWLRDVDGNLWAVATVIGLEVVQDTHVGEMRRHVRAHTRAGTKTLSTHFGGPEIAARHLDAVAATISDHKRLAENAYEVRYSLTPEGEAALAAKESLALDAEASPADAASHSDNEEN